MTASTGVPALSGLVRATPFELPLRARFRGLTARQGVVLEGPAGVGEFSPFADYDRPADAHWVAAAVAAATGQGVGPAVRDHVLVNAILPSAGIDETAALARRAVREQGCTTLKLKVASDGLDDLGRVRAVRWVLDEEVPDGSGRIRLDANASWTVTEAETALVQLAEFGIEYVEQPCATIPDLRKLRAAETGVPIAVDESIRRDRVFEGPAYGDIPSFADIAVLKVSPLGGPRAVARLVTEVGVPVVLSGAMESSVGLAQDVAVAAALPEAPPACGFGTGALLADDLVSDPLLPRDGVVPLRPVVLSDAALERASERLAPAEQAAWRVRLDLAWDCALSRGWVDETDLAALGVS